MVGDVRRSGAQWIGGTGRSVEPNRRAGRSTLSPSTRSGGLGPGRLLSHRHAWNWRYPRAKFSDREPGTTEGVAAVYRTHAAARYGLGNRCLGPDSANRGIRRSQRAGERSGFGGGEVKCAGTTCTSVLSAPYIRRGKTTAGRIYGRVSKIPRPHYQSIQYRHRLPG